ncbi:16S rRNA (cytidine(1402)-2'-O)-methyltransferase [Mycoplasmoides pirum]|uniref:16S rRNA (cytidine(1402)-2'-O)-methyltransferase n=1 Tax=Mycoplasmoides pirum TaxID=2122 RepID=UPI0004867826|nr:16S rRNA (cytidine(1402)-2'-O)-methyltransferase [Mycoplasmoides pirum]
MKEKNKFFVIATPIGNLQEINPRIIASIENCDYLFCEDTRITQKLLNLINIKKFPKLISYHKFNEKSKLENLINLIQNHTCGLISDAGYPSISDPGQIIINSIRKQLPFYSVEVINCSNAIICALVGSGFNTSNFYFAGFLNRDNLDKELELLKNIKTTIVIYESVHRIQNTLLTLDKHFPNKNLCVARELTKQNETYYFGSGSEISKQLILKGEFVIILDNRDELYSKKIAINSNHISEVKELLNLNVRLKDACKFVAKKSNISNSELYKYFQNKKD